MRSLRIRAGGVLLALAAAAAAGDLEDRLEEKLSKEFVRNAVWMTDYDQVKAKAKESGKPIFAYFSRSYAP